MKEQDYIRELTTLTGIQIKKARKEKKLTAANLAKLTGLTLRHINRVEREGVQRVSTLIKICIALNIPMATCFSFDGRYIRVDRRQIESAIEFKEAFSNISIVDFNKPT